MTLTGFISVFSRIAEANFDDEWVLNQRDVAGESSFATTAIPHLTINLCFLLHEV
jgi:hypothetical protein